MASQGMLRDGISWSAQIATAGGTRNDRQNLVGILLIDG